MRRVLRKRLDDNNWSIYPNVDGELRQLLDDCEWYKVYDVVEALYHQMSETPISFDLDKFGEDLNAYLIENGIGLKLLDGRVEVRGPEVLQSTVETAKATLDSTGLRTAQQELHEALNDLSRRPNPDISGAIQHARASLECVARDIAGNSNATLGEIMKSQSTLVPKPLDTVISKAWGYASEHARHIREGRVATYKEAELVVGICAAVSTYLARKDDA